MPTPPASSDAAPCVVALIRADDADPAARARDAVEAGAAAVEVEAAGGDGEVVARAVRAVRAAVTVPVGVAEADGPVLTAALDAGAADARMPSGADPAILRELAARGVAAVLVLTADDPDGEVAARLAAVAGFDPNRLAYDPGPLDPETPDLLAARLRSITAIHRAGRHAVASPEVGDRHGVATVVALATARGAARVRARSVAVSAHAAAVTAAIGGAR